MTDKLEVIREEHSFTRSTRPLFIKIYAGKGNLSKAMAELGYDTLSIDRPEWDLNQKDQRRKLLSMIKDLKPEAVWIAPECRLWSTMQNLNIRTEEQAEALDEERRGHHKAHLSFTGQVYKEQFDGGRTVEIEHPGGSLAWKTKAFKNLPGHRALLDQCMYGAELPDSQGELQPIRKRLQLTDRGMAEAIASFCDGSHDHLTLISSTPAGVWRQLTKSVRGSLPGRVRKSLWTGPGFGCSDPACREHDLLYHSLPGKACAPQTQQMERTMEECQASLGVGGIDLGRCL